MAATVGVGKGENLHNLLETFVSAGTPEAAVEYAQSLHNAVEALAASGGTTAAALVEFLGKCVRFLKLGSLGNSLAMRVPER